jgi:DNA repair protein RecO (recombination protein O)
MALRNDQGIVLRGYSFGEADRIIVLLSPNHGKLRTVAKGVRKTKSRFGGRLEQFTHVDVVLYEGRNLDTITQVSTISAFPGLRADLDAILAASTMVEAVDSVVQEDEPSHRIFLLLQRGLKALEAGVRGADLVTAFLLRLTDAIGLAPALEHCASCGTDQHLDRFSLAGGGVVCNGCATEGAVRLRAGLTAYLAALASADFEDLPDIDPVLSTDAVGITRRFIEYHVDIHLSSLAIIDA